MTVPNKTSKYVWGYQAAVGTSVIIAADSLSYEFGEYNEETGIWNSPFIGNPALPSWKYNSATPTLTDLESVFPIFNHAFLPVTGQFLAWFLGQPVENSPNVDISALSPGSMTYPLTIRFQEDGDDAPQNAQAVDSYCIGLACKAERGREFLVQAKFAFGGFEDIGDNVNLTTASSKAGLMSGSYDGNPIILWDIGGDNTSIPGVWKADFVLTREWDSVSSGAGSTQTSYTYKIAPVQIVLWAVFETLDSWDDYIDRKVSTNMTLQVKKHDGTSNILFTFTNCRINTIKKTGERNKGHYAAVCTMVAEKVEAVCDWFTEGGMTFATHWKAAIA